MSPLERAIEVVGGASSLARMVGVTQSAPSMWRVRGSVPAEHCPAVEEATRTAGHPVFCEELRPDVRWGVLRGNLAPELATRADAPVAKAEA